MCHQTRTETNSSCWILKIEVFVSLFKGRLLKQKRICYWAGLEKLKNPNRSSIFSPQKRKLPNRFSVISVTVVCFHSVLFFSFKIQGASSLLAQRLTYQYCFNTCSININIGISIINSNFAPTVQTRHISSTFIFPISGSLSYWRVLKGNNRRSKAIFALCCVGHYIYEPAHNKTYRRH